MINADYSNSVFSNYENILSAIVDTRHNFPQGYEERCLGIAVGMALAESITESPDDVMTKIIIPFIRKEAHEEGMQAALSGLDLKSGLLDTDTLKEHAFEMFLGFLGDKESRLLECQSQPYTAAYARVEALYDDEGEGSDIWDVYSAAKVEGARMYWDRMWCGNPKAPDAESNVVRH